MGAREDKLLHLEPLERAQQTSGTLDRQLAVERAGRAAEVVVRGEMDYAHQMPAGAPLEFFEGSRNTCLLRQIAANEIHLFRIFMRSLDIEPDRMIIVAQCMDQRVADESLA